MKNNGGGHLNHDLFWNTHGAGARAKNPRARSRRRSTRGFGSFDEFRKKFSDAAAKHFASGWVSLALDLATRKLEIVDSARTTRCSRRAQKTALMILDVWEHAYYVKYQNRRPEFIEAFWNVVELAACRGNFERAGAR